MSRGKCLGCDTDIPITPTTHTKRGLICPMCATSEFDLAHIAGSIKSAAKMGVKPDAKVGKPLWGYRPSAKEAEGGRSP